MYVQDGVTPFWLACKFGNVALIKVLLQHHVDLNSQNKVSIKINYIGYCRMAFKVCT